MRCKDIQEKLLTDYYDDQLSQEEKQGINQHLKDCSECREFFQEACQAELSMASSKEMPEVDPHVWDHIVEQIDEKDAVSIGLWERIEGWFPPRQVLVPIMASIFIAIFVTHRALGPGGQEDILVSSDIEESLSLFSANGGVDELADFGSDIEMYFL